MQSTVLVCTQCIMQYIVLCARLALACTSIVSIANIILCIAPDLDCSTPASVKCAHSSVQDGDSD